MTDIVERLRELTKQSEDYIRRPAAEAADEIEKLRKDNATAIALVLHNRDEIERLRAVLHEIKRCNAQYNFGSKLVRLVDTALET